jgi:AraC-like DNA-binding protein
MKVCNRCTVNKSLSDYHRKSSAKAGRASICKLCTLKQKQEYYQKNKEVKLKKGKEYREANRTLLKENAQSYRRKKPEIVAAYLERNKERLKTYRSKYNKNYYKKNKDMLLKSRLQWQKYKTKTDPVFKLKRNIQSLIRMSVKSKSYKKTTKTAQILGCSYKYLYKYLKDTFESNYGLPYNLIDSGLLHIDHIVPISIAQTEKDIMKLNHYSNLQYLFAWDNLEKSNSLDWELV